MIQETLTRKQNPAVTSDHWHVVHARWSGEVWGEPRFEREIVSEHQDRDTATSAARSFLASIAAEMVKRPPQRRDQILVRRPAHKTLKTAGRLKERRK